MTEREAFTRRILGTKPDILNPQGGIDADAFYAELLPQLAGLCEISTNDVLYPDGRRHQLRRVASTGITKDSKIVVMTSLFHANEVYPLFLWLRHGREIFQYAKDKGVGVIAYPIINEAGLALLGGNPDQVYSAVGKHDIHVQRNGCFISYETIDGQIEHDLGRKRTFARWFLATENPGIELPAETLVMMKVIDDDFSLGVAIVCYGDYHIEVNDGGYTFMVASKVKPTDFKPYKKPGFYFYARDSKEYKLLVSQIKEGGVPILSQRILEIFAENGVTDVTDRRGCIFREDGSLEAWMHQRGVLHAATFEITEHTPQDQALKTYLACAKFQIDLATTTKS